MPTLSKNLLVLITYTCFCLPQLVPSLDPPISLEQFSHLIVSLSEPEAYFDSDNFVSNEAAYLRVLPALKRLGVRGGAYLGVGPDQNYSYIADIQPRLAVIVDIRRQNALQHLYYKALFQLSANRAECLERLFGRAIMGAWRNPERATIGDILKEIDLAAQDEAFASQKTLEAIRLMRSWNIGLSHEDFEAVKHIARAFMQGGPDIKFTSYHRAPRPHHPTYRNLLEERDPTGAQLNYLAREERFAAVKKLHQENRILPLVGDFAGSRTFQGVAEELRRRGLEVRCLYASNVEFYLFRSERWAAYVGNLRSLPRAPEAVIVRAYANVWQPHRAHIPGSYMTTVMQTFRSFLANDADGKNVTYWDLVTRDYIIQ